VEVDHARMMLETLVYRQAAPIYDSLCGAA